MSCPTSPQKVDSNFTGLRYAFEVCPGNLPGEDSEEFGTGAGLLIPDEELGATGPTWHVIEPNSYSDFGATIAKTARSPINAGRQREKGVTTDLDAAGGFQIDFTEDNLYRLAPCFFFAAWRKTPQFSRSSQEGAVTVDNAGSTFDGTDIDDNFAAGELVILVNSVDNTGLFEVTGTASDELTVSPAPTDETLPSNTYVKAVGIQAQTAADLQIDASGSRPALVSDTPDFNFTTILGGRIRPGMWAWLGGDATVNQFATAANNGWARVYSVAAARIEFDKTQGTMVTDTAAGKDIQVFFPDLIQNENDPALIQEQTVQFERSLSTAGYEYLIGSGANSMVFNINTADKVNVDLNFVALNGLPQSSRKSIAGEAFPDIDTVSTAYNTSSDFSRIRLAANSAFETPLFAFITELTLTINNNITANKAIGTLGGFSLSVGDFVATGQMTAYFSDIDAVNAVRNNADVTLDFALVEGNAGWVFDIPLIALGEGRLNVEKDQPITLPLSLDGARHPTLNTTLIANYFPYLPTLAAA